MAYHRNPPGTIRKEKMSHTFEFPAVGHKLTLYTNVYHNVAVSHAYFYENLAASLQSLATQFSEKAMLLRREEGARSEVLEAPVVTEEL